MRRALSLFAALALPLMVASCGHNEESIRATFAQYQKAVTEAKPADAAKLVDSWTANWYAEAARHAANADQFVLEQLDPLMIQTVLKMRSAWTKAELAAMQGRDALTAAIAKGWAGREDIESGLAEIRVMGVDAHGSTVSKPTEALHTFRKEGEAWLTSFRQRIEVTTSRMRKRMVDSGKSVSKFVLDELREVDPKFDEKLLIGPRLTRPEVVETPEPATTAPAETGEKPADAAAKTETPAEAKPVSKPAETPTETPTETPAEKPTDKPAETPAGNGGLIPKRPAGGSGSPDAPAKPGPSDDPDTPADDPDTPAEDA